MKLHRSRCTIPIFFILFYFILCNKHSSLEAELTRSPMRGPHTTASHCHIKLAINLTRRVACIFTPTFSVTNYVPMPRICTFVCTVKTSRQRNVRFISTCCYFQGRRHNAVLCFLVIAKQHYFKFKLDLLPHCIF